MHTHTHTHSPSLRRLFLLGSLQFLVPLHHHPGVPPERSPQERSAMARVVVEGMPETTVRGGVMLNRRRSKARRRKRKELFAVQMCFAGALLGLVVGLQSVARKAGEGPHLRRVPVSAVSPASLKSHVCVVEKGEAFMLSLWRAVTTGCLGGKNVVLRYTCCHHISNS